MKLWRVALMATALFAAGLVACSTDDLIDADGVLDIDDGASDGLEKSIRVDGSSEKTLELETGATLTVPKGAVDRELTIKVERPSDDKALDLVSTLKSEKAVASAPYVLRPHGTQFKNAVTLEIPVQKHEGRELAVAWLEDENDKEWKVLAQAQVQDGKVKVELQHFSVIMVLEPVAAGLDASVPASAADAGADAPDAERDPIDDKDSGDAPGSRADAGVANGGADASTNQPQDAAQPIEVDAMPRDPKYEDASIPYDAGTATSTDADIYLPDAYIDYDAYVPPPYDAGAGTDAIIPPVLQDAGEEPDAIIFL